MRSNKLISVCEKQGDSKFKLHCCPLYFYPFLHIFPGEVRVVQEFGRHLLALTLGMWTPDLFSWPHQRIPYCLLKVLIFFISHHNCVAEYEFGNLAVNAYTFIMTMNYFSAIFYIHISAIYFVRLWSFEISLSIFKFRKKYIKNSWFLNKEKYTCLVCIGKGKTKQNKKHRERNRKIWSICDWHMNCVEQTQRVQRLWLEMNEKDLLKGLRVCKLWTWLGKNVEVFWRRKKRLKFL